ncbi:LOW QUALITY PROTEIN: uncharacterized protein CXorf38-like [Scleropages formosus]|nr:LOW QUALITY PROTEIN: uncharacterized protein CXorf38-like [Scleropages formosus]
MRKCGTKTGQKHSCQLDGTNKCAAAVGTRTCSLCCQLTGDRIAPRWLPSCNGLWTLRGARSMGFEQLGVRLNDAGYKNWLKAGYCLLRVRDALHGYLDNEMKRFHRGLLSANPALRSGQRCRGACKPRGTQFSSACPACGQWRTEILRHHTNRAGQVHWGNCRPWLWPFQHWELAKAYMPRGQAKITRPDQCDAAALLNLINFCDHFSFIEQRAVREVIRHRNELMHSSEMKVSAQWMTHFHGSLDRLLLQLRHVPGIAAAAQEIQEILSVDWSVSIPGSDRVDGAQREGLEPERISHVETQLLRERLQELLLCTDGQAPPDPQDLEELGKLQDFLRSQSDLEKLFQGEFCGPLSAVQLQ